MAGRITLRATRRLRPVSSALKTKPIAPCPIRDRMRYPPRLARSPATRGGLRKLQSSFGSFPAGIGDTLGFKRLVTTRADVPQAVFNHYKVSCRIRFGRGLGGKGGLSPGFLPTTILVHKPSCRCLVSPNWEAERVQSETQEMLLPVPVAHIRTGNVTVLCCNDRAIIRSGSMLPVHIMAFNGFVFKNALGQGAFFPPWPRALPDPSVLRMIDGSLSGFRIINSRSMPRHV